MVIISRGNTLYAQSVMMCYAILHVVYSNPLHPYDCRCAKEWQLALQLYQESHECQLVVAAVGVCSRPEPLKSFLYLDFMESSKYSIVWGMLLETIGKHFHW